MSEVDRFSRTGHGSEQLARVLAFIVALGISGLGVVGGAVGLLLAFSDPEADTLTATTLSMSFLALATGLGLWLTWHLWQTIQGRESRLFEPRRVGVWLLLFVLVVLGGQLILSQDLIPLLLFPPFHIAATLLPVVLILAAVGRSVGSAVRWREMVLQLCSGAFLSTVLAFSLELVLVLSLLLVLVLVLVVQPGGLDLLQALTVHLQDPAWLQDPAALNPLVSSPAVLLAALLVFAGIIPLIEESVKTVGVGLLAYRHPSLSQAYMWGLASGAGFALAEGLFNTTGGLGAWGFVVSLRVGATLLHCFTAGLTGMAWYYVVVERRWSAGLGLFAGGLALHGLWNALAGGMAVISLGVGDGEVEAAGQAFSGLGVAVFLALLVLLASGVVLGLAGATRYVVKRSQAPRPLEEENSPSASQSPTAEPGGGADLEPAS